MNDLMVGWAKLRQETYQAQRFAYTQVCLDEFAQWQRELKVVHRDLLTVLAARIRTPPPA